MKLKEKGFSQDKTARDLREQYGYAPNKFIPNGSATKPDKRKTNAWDIGLKEAMIYARSNQHGFVGNL